MATFLTRWLGRLLDGSVWKPLRAPSAAQQRQYARWLAAQTYLSWTGPWFQAYHYRRAGLRPAWPVQLLGPEQGGPPTGVALLYDERIGPANFLHLFTLLRERVIALGYRVAHADQRRHRCATHAETIEKIVLHPIPTADHTTGPACCNQRFGQVTIDLVRREQRPVFMRLLAAPLPDPVFTAAPPFDELLRLLLGCDAPA